MIYLKIFLSVLFVQVIVFVNMAIFVGLDKLDTGNRIGYSIMSLIAAAVVSLIIVLANSKSKDDGYPP